MKIQIGCTLEDDEIKDVKPFIRNCLLMPIKCDDIIFINGIAQLDGYAIIPKTFYDKLVAIVKEHTGMEPSDMRPQIPGEEKTYYRY